MAGLVNASKHFRLLHKRDPELIIKHEAGDDVQSIVIQCHYYYPTRDEAESMLLDMVQTAKNKDKNSGTRGVIQYYVLKYYQTFQSVDLFRHSLVSNGHKTCVIWDTVIPYPPSTIKK